MIICNLGGIGNSGSKTEGRAVAGYLLLTNAKICQITPTHEHHCREQMANFTAREYNKTTLILDF